MATPVGTGPIVQDVAPKGGFPKIQISRQLPSGRGPRGSVVLGLVTVTMAVGYYKLGQANKARRAEQHEKRLARIALMPMLQAEEDRKAVLAKRFNAQLQKGLHESLNAWKEEEELN
ncbi:unnamed protein product [Ectocarpus sp. 6 AP-2014]